MLTLEEAKKKFPKAVRGVENLKIGSTYIKHYDHMPNHKETGVLSKIFTDKEDIVRIQFKKGSTISSDFASDNGVVSYRKDKEAFNDTNWLEEVE